jgi:hypothetical protein
MFVNMTKSVAKTGKMDAITEIVISNHIIEQGNRFNCLGYRTTITGNKKKQTP